MRAKAEGACVGPCGGGAHVRLRGEQILYHYRRGTGIVTMPQAVAIIELDEEELLLEMR